MATKKAGNLLGRYLALLHRRPFLTNMGTSTVLMMIGDTTAQQIERIQGHQSKLRSTAYTLVAPNSWMPHGIVVEPVRSTVLAFWAGCMGLFWTAWFRRMDILFRGVPKMMGVIGKVTVTAITPPFTNTAFLGMVTMIEETVINKRGDDVDFCTEVVGTVHLACSMHACMAPCIAQHTLVRRSGCVLYKLCSYDCAILCSISPSTT
eukprot:TRINITY_DN9404_c0_g4_i1.p1 TRINITY_DN9404_c0_g4~~TRINITY_DN9404_c0_g4_i1.p1  ORF type:complete len:206 (+),score=0.41 TRINITY_DN9404_c0_g4_i1:197-814(+)